MVVVWLGYVEVVWCLFCSVVVVVLVLCECPVVLWCGVWSGLFVVILAWLAWPGLQDGILNWGFATVAPKKTTDTEREREREREAERESWLLLVLQQMGTHQ